MVNIWFYGVCACC